MPTISRTYRSYDKAARIVAELETAGVASDNISLFASNADGWYQGGRSIASVGAEAAEGAVAGAGVGAALGGAAGLLAGMGLLAIPGVGPVAAAGWLASTAAGAAAGGAAGGIVGALIDAGIPDQDAQYYAESVRRGDTLVVVKTDDSHADRAQAIMDPDAVDIARTREAWEREGWSGFDPERPVSSDDAVRRHRQDI